MKKYTKFTGKPIIIAEDNIDTDKIIPKQFLTTVTKKGLGKYAFYEKRYDKNGKIIKDYFLNKLSNDDNDKFVLISNKNFGCGSSREHAPWALLDFGFKAIIAESFADIFYSNSFKNGLLLIKLSQKQIKEIINNSNDKSKITIDLKNQKITLNNDKKYIFEIDSFKKYCLLEGLDEIGLILEKEKKDKIISNFEKKQKQEQSWLY